MRRNVKYGAQSSVAFAVELIIDILSIYDLIHI